MVDFVVSVAKEVSEAHNGVLAVLDEVGQSTVTDVDLLSRVRDGTGNLPLTLLIGDTCGVTLLQNKSALRAEAYTGETCLVDDGDGGVGLAKVDTKDGRLGPANYGERVLLGLVCLHFEKRSGNINVFVDEDVFARNVNEETIFKISQHVVATST